MTEMVKIAVIGSPNLGSKYHDADLSLFKGAARAMELKGDIDLLVWAGGALKYEPSGHSVTCVSASTRLAKRPEIRPDDDPNFVAEREFQDEMNRMINYSTFSAVTDNPEHLKAAVSAATEMLQPGDGYILAKRAVDALKNPAVTKLTRKVYVKGPDDTLWERDRVNIILAELNALRRKGYSDKDSSTQAEAVCTQIGDAVAALDAKSLSALKERVQGSKSARQYLAEKKTDLKADDWYEIANGLVLIGADDEKTLYERKVMRLWAAREKANADNAHTQQIRQRQEKGAKDFCKMTGQKRASTRDMVAAQVIASMERDDQIRDALGLEWDVVEGAKTIEVGGKKVALAYSPPLSSPRPTNNPINRIAKSNMLKGHPDVAITAESGTAQMELEGGALNATVVYTAPMMVDGDLVMKYGAKQREHGSDPVSLAYGKGRLSPGFTVLQVDGGQISLSSWDDDALKGLAAGMSQHELFTAVQSGDRHFGARTEFSVTAMAPSRAAGEILLMYRTARAARDVKGARKALELMKYGEPGHESSEELSKREFALIRGEEIKCDVFLLTGDDTDGTHLLGGGTPTFDPLLETSAFVKMLNEAEELSAKERYDLLAYFSGRLSAAMPLTNIGLQHRRYQVLPGGAGLITHFAKQGAKIVIVDGNHVNKSSKQRDNPESDALMNQVPPKYWGQVTTVSSRGDSSAGVFEFRDKDGKPHRVYVAHEPHGKGGLSELGGHFPYDSEMEVAGDKHRLAVRITEEGPVLIGLGRVPGNDYTNCLGLPGSPRGLLVVTRMGVGDLDARAYRVVIYTDEAFTPYAEPVTVPAFGGKTKQKRK